MTIVPFETESRGRTVVENPEGQQEFPNAVLIGSFNAEFSGGSNASYDLRIGSQFKDHTEERNTKLDPGESFLLRPKRAIIIQTLENVSLPCNRFGYVVPKGRLLQLGLSNAVTKVDPGYSGRLFVTLFNLGRTTAKLEYGQAFCSLVIHEVFPDAKMYRKGPMEIQGRPLKLSYWERLRDQIDANVGYIALVSLLIAFLAPFVPFFINKLAAGTWLNK